MTERVKMMKTERPHLISPNENVCAVFDITGQPEVSEIGQAIAKAVAANETLQSRIVLDENGDAGYVKMDKAVYRVEVSSKDWQQIKYEEERKAFDLESGEMSRFFILKNGDSLKLFIIEHHLAGDGLSLVYLASDIMSALAGETLTYKPLKVVDADDLPKESDLKPIQKLALNLMMKKWKKESKVFSYQDYRAMFDSYWSSRKTVTLCETISNSELGAMLKKVEEYEISLNSLFVTLFLKAQKGQTKAGVAMSIRDKGDRAMANHVSGLSIETAYDESKSLKQNAQYVHEEIYGWINDPSKKHLVLKFVGFLDPTFIDAASMYLYGGYESKNAQMSAKRMGYIDAYKQVFGITNLTRLDIPKTFGKYEISNFIFIPPVVSYTQCVIGMASHDCEMKIVMNMMNDKRVGERRRFFEEAVGMMKNIGEI